MIFKRGWLTLKKNLKKISKIFKTSLITDSAKKERKLLWSIRKIKQTRKIGRQKLMKNIGKSWLKRKCEGKPTKICRGPNQLTFIQGFKITKNSSQMRQGY